jgi:hypothetical protein
MGGKALNKYGIYTERKNTEDFNRIGFEMKNRAFLDLGLNSSVVICYHTKPDHGDLDLLIAVNGSENINWTKYINNTFKPRAIHHNANVYSFDYENFQIDFIIINERCAGIAKTYYSYDPLGNLMGKSFHKFNLSYGWNGLFYKFRNFNGRNTANILLSTDPEKIFEFGGYDYKRYLQGFETQKDIFDYVITSKYFDNQTLQLHNLNQIDRKRNRKRGSYNTFLKYLEDNKIDISYPFSKNKADYIPMINDFFPEANLKEKLDRLAEKDREDKIIATKFNGDIVMSLYPKLMGKELGNAINKFKNYLGEDYRKFILESDYNTIINEFIRVYND